MIHSFELGPSVTFTLRSNCILPYGAKDLRGIGLARLAGRHQDPLGNSTAKHTRQWHVPGSIHNKLANKHHQSTCVAITLQLQTSSLHNNYRRLPQLAKWRLQLILLLPPKVFRGSNDTVQSHLKKSAINLRLFRHCKMLSGPVVFREYSAL